MKKILLPFFFLSTISIAVTAQRLELSHNWTYSFNSKGASEAASRPSEKEVPWVEKDTLLRKTGLVFFKRTIVIPSSLKEGWTTTGVAALYLGRVLQADETYFNGTLVGKTGSSDVQRVYPLPANLIKWDKENSIEMKVEHWGQKGGATTAPYLAEAAPQYIFSLASVSDEAIRTSPALNKTTTYKAEIKSALEKPTDGIVVAEFFNGNNVSLHKEKKDVVLKNGVTTVPFTFTSPASFLKIVYSLSVPSYHLNLAWNEVAGYEPVVYTGASPKAAYKDPLVFEPALFTNQKMVGYLGDRFAINLEKRLKKVDEAALLEGYINRPGKHPWIGEHAGKFLEAACNAYKSTKDDALKIQIDRTVQQLIAAQRADGYLGTYTTDNEWTSWDVWSHKYNLIGLLSYYELSGYEPALASAQKIGDLLVRRFGTAEGQLNIIKAGTHVGMAATSVLDPMTDLYRFTGDKKYLGFCYYIVDSYNVIDGPAIIKTLNATGRVDKTANAKAYEMLSNLVGLVKLYKITGDRTVLNPVLKAWRDIVANRLYITGTASSFERFQDDGVLPASESDHMGEGCVTVTWIQLNFQLLQLFGDAAYVDELERAVYNHLAGAENPQSGCVSYYTPLQGAKPYGCNITCCLSSVPRGIAMIPLFANGRLKGSPVFNFYQPGEFIANVPANGKSNAVQFITTTGFPANGDVVITVDPAASSTFTVMLRKPYWAKNLRLAVNGSSYPSAAENFIPVKRQWKKGDKIWLHFDLPLIALDGNKSYPNMMALQRGPQVLAYDKTLNKEDANSVHLPVAGASLQDASTALPAGWIGKQGYTVKDASNGAVILLVPYADAGQTGGVIATWLPKKK